MNDNMNVNSEIPFSTVQVTNVYQLTSLVPEG